MDSLRVFLALGPVAVYLLLLGAVNLSGRPLLVTGARDAAALALAVAGLVIVGPMKLFFPFEAAANFGPYVWVLLLVLYAMCVALVLLTLKPRLVIYNLSLDALRPILGDLVDRLDTDARWAGDSLVLPRLGVQLYVDSFPAMRSTLLISAGGIQNPTGWRRLQRALKGCAGSRRSAPQPKRCNSHHVWAADSRDDRAEHRTRSTGGAAINFRSGPLAVDARVGKTADAGAMAAST